MIWISSPSNSAKAVLRKTGKWAVPRFRIPDRSGQLIRCRIGVFGKLMMTDSNTIPGRVSEWLRQHKHAYCDDCIADELNLPRRQQAQRSTDALSQTREFTRDSGRCTLCGLDKKVIQAVQTMEYRTEEIEVGTDEFKTVEYAFHLGDGEVTIFMRYDGTQIDPIQVVGPLIINNHERALVLVRMWARDLYDEDQAASD